MARITAAVDRGYEFCTQMTGREPTRSARHTLNGRATIASVPRSCGEGCGLLGQQGIELKDSQFDGLYNGVKERGLFSDLIFYELGRNFWFYANQTHNIGTTGYAVYVRFLALEAAGVPGGPFRGKESSVFRASVENMLNLYKADPNLDFSNTILAGKAPRNPMGLGVTDLFASFMLRLNRIEGPDFTKRFWRELKKRPRALDEQDGVDNLILAACAAAQKNLSSSFVTQWRWPISQGAQQEADQMFTAPKSGGDGLKAEYFSDPNLATLRLARVDQTVNFDWGDDAPEPGAPSANYSVRWSGKVQAGEDGIYTFYTDVDDGIRLWINGQLLIDQWHGQVQEHSAPIHLDAGQKPDIKLEYFQGTGGARIKLLWSGPNLHRQPIAQDKLFSH